jgi:cytochrome b561
LGYGRVTITLHWPTAILLGLLWTSRQTANFAPTGSLRIDFRSLPITMGVLVAMVGFTRIVWPDWPASSIG